MSRLIMPNMHDEDKLHYLSIRLSRGGGKDFQVGLKMI